MQREGELARRMVDAIERLSVDEAIQMCDPGVELTTLFDRFGEPKFSGHAGVRLWFERLNELWAFIDIRDWKVEDHDDWILVTGTARLRGRASPQVLEMEWASAGEIADGRFTKFGVYADRDEALAAIGAD